MTTMETRAPRRLAIRSAALIGAMALAGCSSGHIGESWQCPLAKGGSCDSVAAADPAVPVMADRTVLKEPLWRVRDSAPEAPPARGEPAPASEPGGQAMETACKADCGGGFDPFGWLWRLFADGDGVESIHAREAGPAPATPASPDIPPSVKPKSSAAEATAPVQQTEPEPDGPAAATLPAEPASAEDDSRADDLRTGEVVARIWIAPFVDAGGVYREASHVRVVLEPAGWRLK